MMNKQKTRDVLEQKKVAPNKKLLAYWKKLGIVEYY
jgi:hypothetical protein